MCSWLPSLTIPYAQAWGGVLRRRRNMDSGRRDSYTQKSFHDNVSTRPRFIHRNPSMAMYPHDCWRQEKPFELELKELLGTCHIRLICLDYFSVQSLYIFLDVDSRKSFKEIRFSFFTLSLPNNFLTLCLFTFWIKLLFLSYSWACSSHFLHVTRLLAIYIYTECSIPHRRNSIWL